MISITKHVLSSVPAGSPSSLFRLHGKVEDNLQTTFRQKVNHVACNLVACGVQQGDVVAVRWPNSTFLPALLHGVMESGAVVAPINPSLPPEECNRLAQTAGAKWVISSEHTSSTVQQKLDFDQLFSPTEHTLPTSPRPGGSQDACILFSSGTTGGSKGVVHTHASLIASCDIYMQSLGKDVHNLPVLCAVPLCHGFGLTYICCYALMTGCPTFIVDGKFSLEVFLQAIETHRIAIAYLVPPICQLMVNAPDILAKYDLSSIQQFVVSGAPLSSNVQSKMPRPTYQSFGMSELLTVITSYPGCNKVGSVGKFHPSVQTKMLPSGELCFKTPSAMRTYLLPPTTERNDGGTEEQRNTTFDEDGYFHSGDLATVDEEGFVFITGREKELIKYQGLQVAPAELEALLLSHHAVRDVAVVSTPDVFSGELPVAFVVAAQPMGAEEQSALNDELKTYVAQHVANHKRLRGGVRFIDTIPRIGAGKILRRKLVQILTELDSASVGVKADAEFSLLGMMREIMGNPGITWESQLINGGLNSIEAVQMRNILLSRFDVDPAQLSLTEFFRHETVADLATTLEEILPLASRPVADSQGPTILRLDSPAIRSVMFPFEQATVNGYWMPLRRVDRTFVVQPTERVQFQTLQTAWNVALRAHPMIAAVYRRTGNGTIERHIEVETVSQQCFHTMYNAEKYADNGANYILELTRFTIARKPLFDLNSPNAVMWLCDSSATDDNKQFLVISLDHVNTDFTSVCMFVNTLETAYKACIGGDPECASVQLPSSETSTVDALLAWKAYAEEFSEQTVRTEIAKLQRLGTFRVKDMSVPYTYVDGNPSIEPTTLSKHFFIPKEVSDRLRHLTRSTPFSVSTYIVYALLLSTQQDKGYLFTMLDGRSPPSKVRRQCQSMKTGCGFMATLSGAHFDLSTTPTSDVSTVLQQVHDTWLKLIGNEETLEWWKLFGMTAFTAVGRDLQRRLLDGVVPFDDTDAAPLVAKGSVVLNFLPPQPQVGEGALFPIHSSTSCHCCNTGNLKEPFAAFWVSVNTNVEPCWEVHVRCCEQFYSSADVELWACQFQQRLAGLE
eukprot:TRINITY_DN52663_c0_g1_i1.p1 TRINITY_DN52663_c0_g1~~TRINITY_DN52663_c0_g1_i1.p1  ORF type:complete len:1072 (-),score=70.59 TRINITY_DN52663_c0_g1_i1:62-3277(-)